MFVPSRTRSSRASRFHFVNQDVNGRDKPGHNVGERADRREGHGA